MDDKVMNWYMKALGDYAVFEGRARRKEYWMYNLISFVIFLLLDLTIILGPIYLMAVILPSIGVAVRRLHDTGRSGWWLLIGLVPLGFIVLVVMFCQDSNRSDNEYGSNPKMA